MGGAEPPRPAACVCGAQSTHRRPRSRAHASKRAVDTAAVAPRSPPDAVAASVPAASVHGVATAARACASPLWLVMRQGGRRPLAASPARAAAVGSVLFPRAPLMPDCALATILSFTLAATPLSALFLEGRRVSR